MAWIKKVLVFLLVGFVLFYLIPRPEGAAAVRTVFDTVGSAFRAIVVFFNSLAG